MPTNDKSTQIIDKQLSLPLNRDVLDKESNRKKGPLPKILLSANPKKWMIQISIRSETYIFSKSSVEDSHNLGTSRA